MMLTRTVAASSLLVTTFVTATAHADPTTLAVAETLFRDAKELVARGEDAAACPKFAASHKLDPKLGTLLNLAACHETVGKTASAWGEFNDARRTAQKQGRADREQYADEHAEALQRRLSIVTFTSAEAVDLELTLDDNTVSGALLRTAVPLDPGVHTLIARRAGRVPVTITVDVPPGPSSKTVTIPALAMKPIDLGFAAPDAASPREATSGQWKRPVGFVALGVGIVGAGLATYFGLDAASKHSDGDAHCSGRACDPTGLELQSSARTSATLSTISAAVGVVGVGAGVFMLLTAPSRAEARRAASAWSVVPALDTTGGGVTCRGAF